jgi:hypothetical protein
MLLQEQAQAALNTFLQQQQLHQQQQRILDMSAVSLASLCSQTLTCYCIWLWCLMQCSSGRDPPGGQIMCLCQPGKGELLLPLLSVLLLLLLLCACKVSL